MDSDSDFDAETLFIDDPQPAATRNDDSTQLVIGETPPKRLRGKKSPPPGDEPSTFSTPDFSGKSSPTSESTLSMGSGKKKQCL